MDTGLQLVSEEFKSSLWKAGYNAEQLPLLWPQVNGEVERQNCTSLKTIQIAQIRELRNEIGDNSSTQF